MEIRKINESEREQILRGDRYAYGNWTEDKIESLDVIPEQTLGVFENDKIQAALRIHPFQQVVRGVITEMGGIGGVWTYPEYRNRGYVRELLNAAFKDMKATGKSVSMLIPFKQSFYQKLGYVTANSNLEVGVPISSIYPSASSREWEFERINASEVQREVRSEFTKLSCQYHGMVLPVYWQRSQWEAATKDKQCILVKHLGQITAIGIYRIDSSLTERKIYLDCCLWSNIEARTKLFSFFANHRDQINYIYLDLPFGINFNQWFGDVMRYEVKINIPPYMVRVVDVEAINIPTSRDGMIDMQVEDPNCDWNNDVFTLKSQDRTLNVRRTSNSKPDLKCTIQGISALVYGTLSLSEIEHRNWIEVIDREKTEEWRSLLESWFPPLHLYNIWRF